MKTVPLHSFIAQRPNLHTYLFDLISCRRSVEDTIKQRVCIYAREPRILAMMYVCIYLVGVCGGMK